MAEFVQLKLEESISILEALKHAKLFDDFEIKAIIIQKREHEYKLRRRKKLYQDYLSYINYEISLLDLARLRHLRVKAQHIDFNSIEHAMNSNIERIFRDALKVFSNKFVVWDEYISFSKKYVKHLLTTKLSRHQLSDITAAQVGVSTIYTDYLACHGANPNSINVWIDAACWEWSEVSKEIEPIERVRALLKRALRYHDTSFNLYDAQENKDGAELLWLVYFRIELEYRDRIMQRSNVIKSNALTKLQIGNTDEPSTLEHIDHNTLQESNIKSDNENDPIMTGQMAILVFKHALKAFLKKYVITDQSNIQITKLSSFIIKFFEIADSPNFNNGPIPSVIDQMLDHLKLSSIKNEVCLVIQIWMVWKKTSTMSNQSDEHLNSSLELMLNAVDKIPTQNMIFCIVDFLSMQSFPIEILKCNNHFHKLLMNCFNILHSSLKCNLIVWEKFLKFVYHFLLEVTNSNFYNSLAIAYENLLTEAVIRHPQVLLFWELLIQIATIKDDCDHVLKVVRDFQLNDSQTDTEKMCNTVGNWLKEKFNFKNHSDVDKMIDLAEIILKTISLQALIKETKVLYLKFVFELQGKAAGITLYQKLKQRPVSLEFFENAINLYKSSALPKNIGAMKTSNRKKIKHELVEISWATSDIHQIELMFEDALEMFGSETPQLWIDYIKFKSCYYTDDAQNMLSSHSHIYQKALKVLQPKMLPLFIESHTLNSLDYYV